MSALPDEEDEEIEDFYRIPVRTPVSASHSAHNSLSQGAAAPPAGSSISSFADFVTAPQVPGRRARAGRSGLNVSHSAPLALARGKGAQDDLDEVLFDEDELAAGSGSATARDGSTSGDSRDEERSLVGRSSAGGSRAQRRRPSRSLA